MCFINIGHWKTGQDKPLQAASAGDIMKIIDRIAFLSGAHEGAGRILKSFKKEGMSGEENIRRSIEYKKG